MNCVAGVIWYDMSEDILAQCAESLGQEGIIGAIFLDGPYKGLAQGMSPRSQCEAIWKHSPLEKTVVAGKEEWASEPVKRTALARAARRWFPEADTLLILDTDEEIGPIDWSLVEQEGGLGYVEIRNTTDLAPQDRGPIAPRIFPLSDSLTWGPKHFDVSDLTQTYAGLGTSLTFENKMACATITHHTEIEKPIETPYARYNREVRGLVEGGIQLILTDDHEETTMLLDSDIAMAYLVGRPIRKLETPDGYNGPGLILERKEREDGLVEVRVAKLARRGVPAA